MPSKRIGQTPNKTTTLSTDLIPFERSNSLNHIAQSDLMVDISTYLLAETKSIVSKTYAQWEVIRAASGLGAYIGKWIFVSDKSVYLTAIAVNQFGMSGFWKNTVSSVDYYNECGFDFLFSSYGAEGVFIWIKDHVGNFVNMQYQSDTNKTNFQFNKSIALGNQIGYESIVNLTSGLGTVQSNTVNNAGYLTANTTLATSNIINCNIETKSRLISTSNAGILSGLKLLNTALITAVVNNGITIENCTFSNITTTLDPAVSYTGKTVKKGFSDFNVTITQTGLTTLTNSATYGAHIGIFNITSTNATETINLFANAPTNHPFRIYPESGLTITFTHATGANQPICAGGVDCVLDGTKGDWAEFTYIGTRYYQTDGETY